MPERTTADPSTAPRLTALAAGGGCACKIPAGRLERLVDGLKTPDGDVADRLLVGLEHGDDAAAVRLDGGTAVLSTADFFTPVVDDPTDWGRIAAANALSDVYAMGGTPVLAINLLGWPSDLDDDLAREVLRGGAEVAALAGCPLAGGHSITAPEPLYGLAVTGTARADALIRNDAADPGLPVTLTKPLGTGILSNRHGRTGEVFPEAVATMTALNREASAAAVGAGVRAGTDVTGFGLLGHLWKLCRASGVAAEIDVTAVPTIPGARESLTAGYLPGGSRRNLDWVRPHLETGAGVDEDDLLLLGDAQTSGGLLLVGEVPDGVGTLIGRTVPAAGGRPTLHLR
ncbi:selenide, water dikinase SelD [Serinicoccus sp. CNJ-927]|uniref:selenide, water dikinase SelD n=1 Tax=Serinicoccus sp. CNJ-927 TaxID=1904970 RepID=UPI000964D7FD|nr:selenide, water dikinase SelD [Serinicoccus sp. CNJ-927]OLT43443.1 selenide, water dikinase SelD [Serinicoccus sp. CNJ-927]